jgi:plasmid maintenance system antidote protein VapI
MYTSIELLDMLKGKQRLPSDYAAAKVLGVTTSSISKIRIGRSEFGIDAAVKVAEILELDPLKIIGCTRIQQAQKQHDKKAILLWLKYA